MPRHISTPSTLKPKPKLQLTSTNMLRSGAAVILALATLGSCFVAGSRVWPRQPAHAALFAAAIMASFGAHAAGHYVAARRSGVAADLPYFVPAFTLTGVNGAYVKLRWPIDVAVFARIFAAGPIAGFSVSTLLYLVGLPISTVVAATTNQIEFGDSLLTAGAQHLIFPGLPPDRGVMLHPVALAGYFGFHFNLWQLLPVGRFDGGRVTYAAFGSRTATVVSWATIAVLVVLGRISTVWPSIAAFGALTMIRLARQHPSSHTASPLNRPTAYLLAVLIGVFAVTFVPVPVRSIR